MRSDMPPPLCSGFFRNTLNCGRFGVAYPKWGTQFLLPLLSSLLPFSCVCFFCNLWNSSGSSLTELGCVNQLDERLVGNLRCCHSLLVKDSCCERPKGFICFWFSEMKLESPKLLETPFEGCNLPSFLEGRMGESCEK